ncbi:hypothetical protein HDU96_001163, partial [Phlyctochytrium bullatum]
ARQSAASETDLMPLPKLQRFEPPPNPSGSLQIPEKFAVALFSGLNDLRQTDNQQPPSRAETPSVASENVSSAAPRKSPITLVLDLNDSRQTDGPQSSRAEQRPPSQEPLTLPTVTASPSEPSEDHQQTREKSPSRIGANTHLAPGSVTQTGGSSGTSSGGDTALAREARLRIAALSPAEVAEWYSRDLVLRAVAYVLASQRERVEQMASTWRMGDDLPTYSQ